MSNEKNDFIEKLSQEQEIDKKQKELKTKKFILEDRKVNLELDKLNQSDRDLAIAIASNFGQMSDEQIENLRKDNIEYINAAKQSMIFINSDPFGGVIPYFRKNILLLCGKTGDGKSTTVANIAAATMRQINPLTKKRRKVLVITNEERAEDVFNRITCLGKGWHYTNHDMFTDEQIKAFDETIKILAKDGWLNVIDNNYNGSNGVTTSIEGIQTIFDNLIRDKIYYDVVIIDYYQNIKFSKKNPRINEWEVQAAFAALMDSYKNVYPAPIVIMAQVVPPDKDRKEPVEFRIKGRKIITDPATLIVEMIADRANLRTEWVIHKSRFNESVGQSFYTGYEKGKFVKYDVDFMKKVAKIKEERDANKLDKVIEKKEEA